MDEKTLTNKELESMLPDVRTMLHALDDKNFTEYERKLEEATGKAIDALTGIIEDGSLALDPEQLVAAVKVLTNAKKDIIESRRKLMETCVRGEVMIRALEQDDKSKDSNSVLLEYLKRAGLDTTVDKTGTNPGTKASIFESISQDNERK